MLALLMAAVCLTLQSFLIISPQTPLGRHCPTAQIQWVRDRIPTGTSSEPIRLMKVRKPKTGEVEFVQCRCAEKKAAESSEKKMLSTRFEIQPTLFLFEEAAGLLIPTYRLPKSILGPDVKSDYRDWCPSPQTPPPLLG